ncbi:MAG: holliday junction helicase RuvA [Frankiales bacterium]|jgi:Holliday junction DNA helicase RuvA|nr:holliday junction helicase RuvA [Frankiales bacterium]
MIASLTGRVTGHTTGGVVVSVGGVGLAVQTTPGTKARLRTGDEAFLATTLVVREDSLTLYGFETDDERELFEVLQTASGIGPKVAQAVLTTLTPDAVRRAIATNDLATLTLVSGIGKKGAERMVLELRDKLGMAHVTSGSGPVAWRDTLTEALVGLGWSSSQADEVVVKLSAAHPNASDPDVPSLLREALQMLGKSR